MALEICCVGGYGEVGKNMLAVKAGDDVVIIDMGIYIPAIISFEADVDKRSKGFSADEMIACGAVADDRVIEKWRDNVRAIVVGHAHLDHLAGIEFLGGRYAQAPIIGTPFTVEVLKAILSDDKVKLPNKIRAVNPNSFIKVSENVKIELINITHSTLQAAMVAVHTPYGILLYANDFKFDNHPVLGRKPNLKRLKELGENGVSVLVVESLYSDREMKTPSEKVARELLQDVLLSVNNEGKAVFVTTFASHLARIKSIIDFGKKLGRKVVLIGRSMGKYVGAAENVGLVNFSKKTVICSYKSDIRRILAKVNKERGKYLVVCTGNQAEPGSVLDRIVKGDLNFKFEEGDHVIFSCKTIPEEINIANRAAMEEGLKRMKVRIFTDIHQSGHASREDLRDFINMVKPKHIIPAHGKAEMLASLAELAEELGYKIGENVHILYNGQKIIL